MPKVKGPSLGAWLRRSPSASFNVACLASSLAACAPSRAHAPVQNPPPAPVTTAAEGDASPGHPSPAIGGESGVASARPGASAEGSSPSPAPAPSGSATTPGNPAALGHPANAGASQAPGSVGSSANAPIVPGGLARGSADPFDRALFAGDEAYFADDLARAKAAYASAARLSPNDPAARLGGLRVELAASNVPTDFAIAPKDPRMLRLFQDLDRLARRHPNYGPVAVERGRVLLILGRAEPAIEGLGRGVELSPSDPEAHSALAVALLATGKPKEAIPRFQRAVELDADSADRHRNLGTAQLMVGDVRKAIVAYQRAVALAPEDPRAHSDLGTALLASNAVELALPELRRAIELDPKRATFRSNLAYANLLKGDLDAAEREAREAVRLDPKLGSGFINLGTVQARRGQLDEAERSYRKALALDPSDPRVQASLSELGELRKKPASNR